MISLTCVREHLVDLADPVLDVGFDVFGDNLARLDDLVEELAEIVFGPGGFLVRLRPGRGDHLVQQIERLRFAGGGAGGLFGTAHTTNTWLKCGVLRITSFAMLRRARSAAFHSG